MASAHNLGQVVVEADALLGGLGDQGGVLAMTDAQEDAAVGLASWRTRLATVADGAGGYEGFAAIQGFDVGLQLFGKVSHGVLGSC